MDSYRKPLLRHFLTLVIPPATLAVLWAALRHLGLASPPALPAEVVGPALFILAVVLALAAPLWVRSRFVASVARSKSVDGATFLAFEKRLLSVSLPSAWAAAVAYMLGMDQFHFAGAMLAALYAGYYYYPSGRRVAHEMRLFRVDMRSKEGERA